MSITIGDKIFFLKSLNKNPHLQNIILKWFEVTFIWILSWQLQVGNV